MKTTNQQENEFGLYAHEMEKIKAIFAEFEEIEEVWLFGSRSMENFRFNSDFDLALVGEAVNRSIVNAVKDRLEDVFFPLSFDVVDYKTITHENLLKHIREEGKTLYDRIQHKGSSD